MVDQGGTQLYNEYEVTYITTIKIKFFTMETENPELRKEELIEMADKLDHLQQAKNDGRGVSCVKDVITYLRRGDFEQAKRIATHDHDKIGAYPDIEELMEYYGLCVSYKTAAENWKEIIRKDEME